MKLILEAIKSLFRKLENRISNFGWGDLKDKPFYTETRTIPRTVLADVELWEFSDGYIANVETSIGFAAGDVVEVTFSGSNRYADVTLRGIAYAPNDFEVAVDLDHPDDNSVRVSFTEGRNMQIVSEWYTHAIVALPTSTEVVVHPIEPKYLPNSVWTEKKTRVIMENQAVKGVLHLANDVFFTEGETVTVVWDGVPYERVAGYNGTVGEKAYLFDIGETGEPFAIQCSPSENIVMVISVNGPHVEEENTHTVSVYVREDVVKTNCDLQVKVNIVEGEEYSADGELISGDFAAAKAKALIGMPITCLEQCARTLNNGETLMKCANIGTAYYVSDVGEEFIQYEGYSCFTLFPDNTLAVD